MGGRRRSVWAMAAVAVLAAAVAVVGGGPPGTAPAAAEGFGPAGTLMLGLEEGAATGATTQLVGWGLSAIGLDNEQDEQSQEIIDELDDISGQLTDISDELTELNSEIANETCTLDTSDTTNAAVSQISNWNGILQDYLGDAIDDDGGATNAQIEALVDDILDDDTGAAYQLSVINTALLNEGISDGIISSCLATLATPTADTAGDLTYYDAVSNLTMYFYTVQVQGLNLLVEALHAAATQAWTEANGIAALDPGDALEVCSDAPNITVLDYCNQATGWMTEVYENVQEQFSVAGAPYSVWLTGSTTQYGAATMNGTPYVMVTSLEDFTASQTDDCPDPLTSADPCGPTVGTNLTTSFPMTTTYASRTNWTPATAEVWQTLLTDWTTDSQTLGTFLADQWDFQNTDNVTKVFLTPTTYTADPEYDSEQQTHPFSLPAVCFGDTSAERSIGHEPFCYNGSNDGLDYGEASDVLVQHWQSEPYLGCAEYYAPSSMTDEDTNGFYDYLYSDPLSGETCQYGEGWKDDILPGWVLDDGVSDEQYLFPVFDMSTATCNTNDNGSTRSTTNVNGVYTMCGDDFDTWFATIVPDPADNVPTTTTSTTATTTSTTSTSTTAASTTPTATVSSSIVSPGDTVTITTSGWDSTTTVTTTLQSTPVQLDQSTVDASGRLVRTVTIPPSTEPGSHGLHLVGTYHDASYEVVVPITVRASTTGGQAGTTTGTLPRTGAPLGALGLGAALVLGGSAAIAATRRRRPRT